TRSRNVIESIATVTHGRWAWRMAAMAAVSSTILMMTPPWTCPRALAWCGSINCVSVTRDAAVGFGAFSVISTRYPRFDSHARLPGAARGRQPALLHGSPLLHNTSQHADLRSRAWPFHVRQGVRREGADVQPRLRAEGAQAARSRDRVLHLAAAA